MGKTALIVGAGGQDGRLLETFLRTRGYRLTCVERAATRIDDASWKHPVDITRSDQVFDVVSELRPDEIYHLAAIHHSTQENTSEDLAFFRSSYEVNFFSLLNFLEGMRLYSPRTRLFYAASSHVFGHTFGEARSEPQNEETPFRPQSVYAMTKVDGILACRQYRMAHQVFAAVGILYNHESRFRTETFLSRKVIRAAVAIKRGSQNKLVVGDLGAEVDWGYAPDYVEAMHAILSVENADEFVVATGTRHTVKEFIEAAFVEVNLDWKQHVLEDSRNMGKRRQSSIGDSSKLARLAQWKPSTPFLEMIRLLVRDEIQGVV